MCALVSALLALAASAARAGVNAPDGTVWLLAAATPGTSVTTTPAVAAEGAVSAASRKCEYGIAKAMSGNAAAAESAFVSLLSDLPGDARALNNLGNCHLMRGEPDVGLAFYDWAARSDSADAGIHLNRATAYMLSGDQDRAQREAEIGVRLAGGPDAAGRLLGLKSEEPGTVVSKASEHTVVSPEELRALIRAAATTVPADSTKKGTSGTAGTKGKAKPTTWRSGGTRASGDLEVTTLLYWKR